MAEIKAGCFPKFNRIFLMVLFTVLCVFFLSLGVRADSRLFFGEDYDGGMYTEIYDAANGLPTAQVVAVAQTPDGFMWFGGPGGLIRYDGRHFENYSDASQITGISCLYTDDDGALWIGCTNRQVFCIKNGSVSRWDGSESDDFGSVTCIVRGIDDNTYIGSDKGVVYIANDGTLRELKRSSTDSGAVSCLVADSSGYIYGLRRDGSIMYICFGKLEKMISPSTFPQGKIAAIAASESVRGQLYMALENNKILRVNLYKTEESIVTYSLGGKGKIHDIRIYDGSLWVCRENSLGCVSALGSYSEIDSIPIKGTFRRIFRDVEGNFWLISPRNGIMKIVRNHFLDVCEMSGLGLMSANVVEKHNRLLYIGADEGLFAVDDARRPVDTVFTNRFEGYKVNDILSDSSGNLWIATSSSMGLILKKPDGEIKRYTSYQGLSFFGSYAVCDLLGGRVAVAVNGGVAIIEDGIIREGYFAKDGLPSSGITSLCRGRGGIIYMGSDGDGLYMLDKGRISRVDREDELLSGVIINIVPDEFAEEAYFVITENSVAYLTPEGLRNLSGFPSASNNDIFFDSLRANMWITATDGVYVVDYESVLAGTLFSYTHYNTDSGMKCYPTPGGRSCYDGEQTIYVTGSNTVLSFNIYNNSQYESRVSLSVPHINVDGEDIAVNDRSVIELEPNVKRIELQPYAISYALYNPIIKYTISGPISGTGECDMSDMENIIINKPKGGSYRITFCVLDRSTHKIREEKSIKLVKKLAFYEMGWVRIMFVCVIGFVMAALGVILYKNRTKSLRSRIEKDRVFSRQMFAALGKIIDSKTNVYGMGHSQRVADYSKIIAMKMGYNEKKAGHVYDIALLHDIGKLGIPDSILGKHEKLTPEEEEILRLHAEKGFEFLKSVTVRPMIAVAAGYHHEHYDGSGYPFGLYGNDIPEVARIIAVADAFDNLNTMKNFNDKPLEEILVEMKRLKGTILDSNIVELFLDILRDNVEA